MGSLPPAVTSSVYDSLPNLNTSVSGLYIDPSSQPGRNPLTLGSVTFATSECPDKLTFGLTVNHKVTELIGGSIRIASFGVFPKPITWTGRIWESNATARIAALKQLMSAQVEIPYSFKAESGYGIITDFDPEYLSNDCNYSITFKVTRISNGTTSSTAPVSLDTQVAALTSQASDRATAISAIDPSGGAALSQQVTNVTASVGSAGPLAQLFGSGLTSVLNTVQTATSAALQYAGALLPGASQYVLSAQLGTTFGLIGRVIQAGQSSTTVTAFGESLAEIAATHCGNADLGPAIGAYNGITGIRTPPGQPTTIIIPPFAVTQPTPGS